MLSKLAFLAFVPCFLGASSAQGLQSNIPPEEAEALPQVVEDNAEDMMTIFKDWQSPEYPLIYRKPLPIPPVKQPKM